MLTWLGYAALAFTAAIAVTAAVQHRRQNPAEIRAYRRMKQDWARRSTGGL